MDQLDRYIENIVSQKISEPENLDKIIMDAISSAKCQKKMLRKLPTKHNLLKEKFDILKNKNKN